MFEEATGVTSPLLLVTENDTESPSGSVAVTNEEGGSMSSLVVMSKGIVVISGGSFTDKILIRTVSESDKVVWPGAGGLPELPLSFVTISILA